MASSPSVRSASLMTFTQAFGAGVVRLSPTPPSKSRCNVSNIIRFRIHLNARLFSPPPVPDGVDKRPRRVESLSLGASTV